MFVLGHRAKKMRQTKLADLIHQSEDMVGLESCTVHVHFAQIRDLDGEAYETVAGSELVVSRTALRNSRNTYAINGQPAPFSDVATLLKGHGIDLDHKRFLILQGEVESIAQMKPKAGNEHEEGLLEYLEDIVGTAGYVELLEQTAKGVDETSQRHSDKLVRVRVAQKECQTLQVCTGCSRCVGRQDRC